MFDLEHAIAEWRRQMLAAGIQTPAPLEELEAHLRDDVDRLIQSGLSKETAFEMVAKCMGLPHILKTEFKKNEGAAGNKFGIVALGAGVVMILQALARHYVVGDWNNHQVAWVLYGERLILLGLGVWVFNFKLGGTRDLRFWKLVGVTYSLFAAWKSLWLLLPMFIWPGFDALFGSIATLQVLAVTAALALAATGSIVSVLGWEYFRGVLPVIHSQRARALIGLSCCVLGPGFMAFFVSFVMPVLTHFSVPLLFILMGWAWVVVAVLGGVGLGLTETAHEEIGESLEKPEEQYV